MSPAENETELPELVTVAELAESLFRNFAIGATPSLAGEDWT